ncbi:Hpt domain-containing protein [Clostridium cylindrosporum]|uniref:Chemotaxis protein histidine kinase n=1 Tax=Clostridium cylindrosporum DSM 605 TaxID=1121307 RepID=A0A0J8D824_CLOCY|nr:Hpt domain-containing protein [Clostridium cylindrosporum]KMT22002.1 chemotaxis protein histidine kinase [Clostridium cylindrosporum DSM 605]
MNNLSQMYFEETDELIQEAEYYMLELEKEYTQDNINGVFRCIHSIKGSSASMDFVEIANLSHSLEDMLNFIREGKLESSQLILNLCFEAIDQVKFLVNHMKSNKEVNLNSIQLNKLNEIQSSIEDILKGVSLGVSEEKEETLTFKVNSGNYINKFFIRVSFDDDMFHTVTRFLVVNTINELGFLEYSSPGLSLIGNPNYEEFTEYYECILNTNYEEEDIHIKLNINYVNNVQAINLSNDSLMKADFKATKEHKEELDKILSDFKNIGKILKTNSLEASYYELEKSFMLSLESFDSLDNDEYLGHLVREIYNFEELFFICAKSHNERAIEEFKNLRYIHNKLSEKIYTALRNKVIFKYHKLKCEKTVLNELKNFFEKLDKEMFKYILVDISNLEIIQVDELKYLINIYKSLREKNISIGFINRGIYKKRIFNIFDSIDEICCFNQYNDEFSAVKECI